MKRVVVSLMLVVVMAASLVACGSKSDSIVGTYKMTKVSMSGLEVSVDEYLKGIGQTDGSVLMEVKEDGTYTVDMAGSTDGGTWEETDGKITMDGLEVTLDGKILTMIEPSSQLSMTFERQ